MDLPSSEESEEEVENKHRGAEGDDEVPLDQKIKVRAAYESQTPSVQSLQPLYFHVTPVFSFCNSIVY